MSRKRILWIIPIVLLLAAGGVYFYFANTDRRAQAQVQEPTIATTTATRGDLVLTASGSGTLEPVAEIALGFRSSGLVSEVMVKVGDTVEAGQVLARLDDTSAQIKLTQAKIALRQAEIQFGQLGGEPDAADLLSAQASLASARADLDQLKTPATAEELAAARDNLASAQQALNTLLAGPSAEDIAVARADLELAEIDVRKAQTDYDKVAWRSDVGSTSQAATLQQATLNYDKAKANYDLQVAGASAEEVSAARAKVAQAQNDLNTLQNGPGPEELSAAELKVAQAQAQVDNLLAGASVTDLETSQLDVDKARNDVASAQADLDDTELRAPIAGTILSVDVDPGEAVGTSAIITLADMNSPRVVFWVEETDLLSAAVGNPVNIVFEALPDYTYTGEIVQVAPALVTVDNTPAVQIWASIDLTQYPVKLLGGMNAEVEIVAGEAANAVLVPVQALRQLGPDRYAVFVVKPDGELEMRMVEVGLKDYVNAEIRSGVQAGEVVSTGTKGSSGSSVQPANGNREPGPDGAPMMRFFGG